MKSNAQARRRRRTQKRQAALNLRCDIQTDTITDLNRRYLELSRAFIHLVENYPRDNWAATLTKAPPDIRIFIKKHIESLSKLLVDHD